ncbi:hypothetical protein [Paenibacillus sp. UNC451MF]|uniref:hypothetical protein n=1 Tax=Paenibacillus sp. UNC451MF TaxID=1449063 RepID=UPI00048CD4F2|nr:hypothetical protein [Paenibacillus sp. UNC451MF]
MTKVTRVRLPQPVGIRLEIARAGGLSDEALISVIHRKDTAALQQLGPEQLTWDILTQYGEENREELKQAILDGYEFKFLTVRGLIHYISYRFGLKEQVDYQAVEGALEGLKLTRSNVALLQATIPAFWQISVIERNERLDEPSSVHLDLVSQEEQAITIRIERLHHQNIHFEGGEAG